MKEQTTDSLTGRKRVNAEIVQEVNNILKKVIFWKQRIDEGIHYSEGQCDVLPRPHSPTHHSQAVEESNMFLKRLSFGCKEHTKLLKVYKCSRPD